VSTVIVLWKEGLLDRAPHNDPVAMIRKKPAACLSGLLLDKGESAAKADPA
jgi:hypothetical protein